jgi:hypothetical protein
LTDNDAEVSEVKCGYAVGVRVNWVVCRNGEGNKRWAMSDGKVID